LNNLFVVKIFESLTSVLIRIKGNSSFKKIQKLYKNIRMTHALLYILF